MTLQGDVCASTIFAADEGEITGKVIHVVSWSFN